MPGYTMVIAHLTDMLRLQIFVGQILGTAAGTSVYNRHGWRAAAALNLGWQGFCVLALLVRGPYCPRYTWFGYKGGLHAQKREPAQKRLEDTENVAETKLQKDFDEKTVETAAEDGNRVTTSSVGEAHAVNEESRTKHVAS
jgi:hypothetical protein